MSRWIDEWPHPMVGEITEWQLDPWGERTPLVIMIGYAEDPADRIKYRFPRCVTEKHLVVNHDEPLGRQRWRRFPDMPEWSWKAVRDRASEFRTPDGKPDMRWFDDYTNLSQEMIDHRNADDARRMKGLWIRIKGCTVYITGKHYMLLQHSVMNKTVRPDFRERDMVWFWAWQAVQEDMFCYGMNYLKHRRDGFSSKAAVIMTEEITRMPGSFGAITSSYDKDHAKDILWPEMFTPQFMSWPPYFIPETEGGIDQPVGGKITWGERRRRGAGRMSASDEALVSRSIHVVTATNEKSKGDGGKIRMYFWDEIGKEAKRLIMKVLGTIKPALTQGGVYGKILTGSTVEEAENGTSIRYVELVEKSMPSKRQPDGFTPSGLYFLFFPCFYCLDEDYIDRYGMSITGKPDADALEYQRKRQWPRIMDTVGGDEEKAEEAWAAIVRVKYQGGSLHWVENYRASATDPVELAHRKRLYPMTPDDALLPSAREAYFDQNILSRALRDCEAPDESGHAAWKGLTRTGRFEPAGVFTPTEGPRKGQQVPDILGEIRWVDYPEGHEKARFTLNARFIDGGGVFTPNAVARIPAIWPGQSCGGVRPLNTRLDGNAAAEATSCLAIGVDPYDWDTRKTSERSRDLSKAGAFCKVNEPGHELEGWYVWMYHARPPVASDFQEDMLMAAIWCGTAVNVERDRSSGFQQHFESLGCISMLKDDQLLLRNDPESAKANPKKGTKADHDIGFGHISNYVSKHIAETQKFPFPAAIRQLMSVTMETIGKHDLVAGMEQTEMVVAVKRVGAPTRAQIRLKAIKKKRSPGGMPLYPM